ncbi:Papain_family cysteine protease [Hexamita inflata]|uniref:Papain family cysteine protease n=1 Tax=Hexamita inflata TaxID=28002 RepID=A0AA86UAI4_9EUKA|nr:Papain family cysteine protease [Hexamita inflata]
MEEVGVSYQHLNKTTKFNVMNLSIMLLATICILSTLIISSINLQVSYDIMNKEPVPTPTPSFVMPKSFGIHTAGSVRDQQSRGTCWDFATMRFLEERYRVQAVAEGFLKPTQFVRFSEQAHGINIINFCKANPKKCPDTPQTTGIATDGYPSWIFHFGEYLNDKLTVDLPSCPYTPQESPVTDQQCDGMKEFQAKKLIKYNVTDYKFVQSVSEIKKALVEKNSLFPMVTELMWMEDYVPCEFDLFLGQTDFCVNKQKRCPRDLQNEKFDRYCFVFTLLTTSEAEFIAKRYRKERTLGAHAMLIVGYNDEYQMVDQNKGGFIVQNSWGPVLGHSLDYLLGKISRRDEEYICPNYFNQNEWVPIDCEGEDKWKLRKPTVLTFIPQGIKSGHYHTEDWKPYQQALKIKDLKDTVYYVMKSFEQFVDGTFIVKLGITHTADPNQDFSKITEFVELPPLPLDYMPFFFVPTNVDASMVNNEECGYYFIPYDFVDLTFQNQGLWFMDVMDVTFDKYSFTADADITKATIEQVKTTFTSHTPWLQDENMTPKFK